MPFSLSTIQFWKLFHIHLPTTTKGGRTLEDEGGGGMNQFTYKQQEDRSFRILPPLEKLREGLNGRRTQGSVSSFFKL